jgi:hypothetical protein
MEETTTMQGIGTRLSVNERAPLDGDHQAMIFFSAECQAEAQNLATGISIYEFERYAQKRPTESSAIKRMENR